MFSVFTAIFSKILYQKVFKLTSVLFHYYLNQIIFVQSYFKVFFSLLRVWKIVGSSPDQVKPKTMQLVYVAALARKSKDMLAQNQNNVSE